MGDTNILKQSQLKEKIASLETQKKNIDQFIWNAQKSYYNSLGESGQTELNSIINTKIEDDYKLRTSEYENLMNDLYNNYYDKLYILFINKNYNNKQIEIINNTQFKIIEQRNVENNLMNNLTTQNRIRDYKNNIYRNKKKIIHNFSFLITFLFLIIITIILLNYSKFKGTNNKFNLLSTIIENAHKKFFPFYLIIILIIIIVFKQFNLAILFLVIYSIITLLSSISS